MGHLPGGDLDSVAEVVRCGEQEALAVLSSHAATRELARGDVVGGLACPVTPRDFVRVRIDPTACIACGICAAVCETDALVAAPRRAPVRNPSNYECTRDHACARNCPTGAISLGNL